MAQLKLKTRKKKEKEGNQDNSLPVTISLRVEDQDQAFIQSEWRTRSLLNRNAEGYYKFSHKSIFLAFFI